MEETFISKGKHWLSGVQEFHLDCGDERNWTWDDVDGYAIVVDGETYLAIEDPDDGYRSYAYMIKPDGFDVNVTNLFEPQLVYADECNETIEDDGWTVKDAKVFRLRNQYGQTILEVSTDYSESYYPLGIVEYHPENLPCNVKPLVN